MSPKQGSFAAAFATSIERAAGRVRKDLEKGHEIKIKDDVFRKAFSAQVTALAHPETNRTDATYNIDPKSSPISHLQSISSATLQLANQLVKQYDDVSRAIDDVKPSSTFATNWEEDLERLRRLLEVGYDLTSARIDAMMTTDTNTGIAGKHEQHMKTAEEKLEEIEVEALLMLDATNEVHGQSTLGQPLAMSELLKSAEKGMAAMTRVMPEE